jgi:hypothetical protein
LAAIRDVTFTVSVACFVLPAPGSAQSPPSSAPPTAEKQERIDEIDRKIDVLSEELRKLKEQQTVPEKRELKSAYGLGPAASKVYQVERGLSLGGYGEFNLKEVVGDEGDDTDVFDFVRLVLYTGYKFNDWIVFNSEIEFEHASTGQDGSVSVEFATLDFLLHEHVNARAGLLLVPVGFINEIHEPPFFHGNQRPEVERQIIPSTWRANGAGLFGEVGAFSYRTYVVSSLDASGFGAGNIRDARQNGSEEIAENFSWVGRVDVEPATGLLFGGSAYLGNSGQDQVFTGEEPDVFTQLYEIHAEYERQRLELRALGTLLDIEDTDLISAELGETIAERSIGYYGEIAYDVLPWIVPGTSHYLAPWYRYSRIDTQHDVPSGFVEDEAQDRQIHEVGLTYKPIPQVVIKADYRNQDPEEGELPDEIRLGAGFVF